MKLSPQNIRLLKEKAHHLDPIARVGDSGISEGFLKEVNKVLDHHELIKIRLSAGDKATKKLAITEICEATKSICVQSIGHTATIYRQDPEQPKIALQ